MTKTFNLHVFEHDEFKDVLIEMWINDHPHLKRMHNKKFQRKMAIKELES